MQHMPISVPPLSVQGGDDLDGAVGGRMGGTHVDQNVVRVGGLFQG